MRCTQCGETIHVSGEGDDTICIDCDEQIKATKEVIEEEARMEHAQEDDR